MAEKTLVITPYQLAEGYRYHVKDELVPGTNHLKVRRGEYRVLAKLRDGNYLVKDPSNV